jgi:branched-chain amino acid transport system permease protein
VTHHVLLADSFNTQINLVKPILDGIFQGSAYGLLALGLVLLYKSNRIFNFAQGEFATFGALVAYLFVSGSHLDTIGVTVPKVPYGVALGLGIIASVLIALAAERAVIRPMFDRPRVVLVVGTIGIALLLIGLEGLFYPHVGALPTVSDALKLKHPYVGHIDGLPIMYQDLANFVVLVVLAAMAFLFFRYTRTGTAILAVSQDTTAARVVGISVERISQVTWAIAGLLGGVAGVLLAVPPQGSVTPGGFTGTSLTVAFAAAVLGGFTSLPGAFLGGILIGLVESFANADYSFVPGLSGLPSAQNEVAVAVVLLLVLLVRPRGFLGSEA